MTAEMRDTVAWDLIVKLEERDPKLYLSILEAEPADDGPVADLLEARRVIAELSEIDTSGLRSRLFEAADMIEGALTGGAQSDRADLAYVLDAFSQSVDQLELLQARLADVTEQLRGAAAEGDASDVLIALLIQRLIDRLGGGGEVEPPQSAVDIGELRSGINAIAERIRGLEQLDPGHIASSLRELAYALPEMDHGASARMMSLIDTLVEQGAGGGDRLQILARGVGDHHELRKLAADAAGDSTRVYVQSAGAVQPDARTAVLQLLVGARRVVTILVALLFFVVVYVFDVTTLLSFIRRTAEVNGESRTKTTAEVLFWGSLFGAVTLTAIVWLASGGETVGVAVLLLAGWLLGALLALPSERLGGVDRDQFLSALSLGVAEPEIMREVIIPAGRPGLLYWLTRPGRKFGRRNLAGGHGSVSA